MSAQRPSDAATVRAATLAALPDLVQQWLPDGQFDDHEYVARNPLRNDRNLGSFRVNIRTGQWRDHAIGVGGREAVSLYAYLWTAGDYDAALKALASDPLIRAAAVSGATAPAKPAKLLGTSEATQACIARIFAEAVGLAGMPAAVYLRSRGLRPTDAWDRLRASVQHYPGVGPCAALIAPMEAFDGSLAGLHRTYLTPGGDKLHVPNPRRSLGRVRGCAIRLGEAAEQLIICEGLEDGLTLYQKLTVPVWVAGGASFLHLMELPDAVRSLIIAADNDAAGEHAAQRALDAFDMAGRDVRIMRPEPSFKDFNDQLRGVHRG